MALTDWGRRCALVIQSGQVTDNEVNFPLLVTEDTLPSEIFDADGSYPALNGGGDIRFSSDSDGNTQLACEIESFITDNDPANGKAAIWVKIPSLSSSSNQTIFIWYNKAGESQPAEDNAYGKENVWDANFKMVQHMNQIPDGTAGEIVDSTSNDNDGTTYNMDSADQVAGQIDGSLDFDGGDDYVDVGTITLADDTPWSVSMWVKPDSISTKGFYGNQYIPTQYTRFWAAGEKIYLYNDANQVCNWEGTGLAISNQQQIVIVCDGTDSNNIELYVNTIPIGLKTLADSTQTIKMIGGLGSVSDYLFNGIIDEVRISNVARSAGWIATEYNNQNAPGTFLIEGTPETPGAAPITFIPQIIMF